MAISFTVSYTFAPSTTISSSQVNTNFSDNAGVWTGLEAKTKSFSNLVVDTAPTSSTDVAIKSYVDRLNGYRRPNLRFASITTVSVEQGLDGTSGDVPILFPDGTVRTETSTTRTTFNITRNAVLLTSGAQSGLRTSLSEATNTWYALYAAKVTDSSTLWCTVGDTTLPTQANYATLNSRYGTSGWVYLGLIRNGNNSGATGDICDFQQCGAYTTFNNSASGTQGTCMGITLANASSTSITYSYTAGTGTTDIPSNISHALYQCLTGGPTAGNSVTLTDSSATITYFSGLAARISGQVLVSASLGAKITAGSGVGMDLYLAGFLDGVLGTGSNTII